MEFQLFKQATITDYVLPRIGSFADFLENDMVQMYQDTDGEHPELADTALWLADRYFGFDPEEKLFTSMNGLSIEDNVSRKVLKFSSEDIASLQESLKGASIPVDTKVCKTLLNIVVTEAIALFYAQEIRSNPELMFNSKIDATEVRLIRTAATQDDADNKHDGPGRKKLHVSWRPTEAAAPTVGDVRDIYSMMAYNSAFNALVGSKAMGVHKMLVHGFARDSEKVLLSQLAINFETSQYFDASLKAIDKALKQGKKIKMKDGTPITPNPSIGPFFGTDYRQVLATEGFSEFAEKKGTAKSIMQFISSGQEDKKGRFLPYAFVSRRSLYGEKVEIDESGSEVSSKEDSYVGISAKVSMKALSSRYNGKYDQMKSDLEGVLLRGFQTHISLMKANGIPLAKFKNLIPALQDQAVFDKVEESLVNILSSIPSKFKSFDAAKAACEAAVATENAKIGQLPPTAKGPGNFTGFVDYVAQVVLKLPIQFAGAIKTFEPTGMLRPTTEKRKVPASDVPRSDYVFGLLDEGSREALLQNMSFDDIFSAIVSSSGHGSAGTYAYNQLISGKDGQDFFDLCARFENAPNEKDRKNPKDLEKILNKLKYLNDQVKKATQKGLKRQVGNIGGSSIKNIFSQLIGNEKLASVAYDYLFGGAMRSLSVSNDVDLVALRKDIESNNINSAHLLVLVADIAGKLPKSYNVEDESRIISDFDGAKVYSLQAPDLYKSPTSAVMSRVNAAFHLAFEGSFNNAMHSMLSNGMVARYSQNASEFKSYVDANYSKPEITEEDADRVLSLSEQVEELNNAKVFEKFIQFDESELKPMEVSGLKVIPDKEARRLASVSMKFQKFFQRNSKTSIVAELEKISRSPTVENPRQTFSSDYFDAFCVMMSDRFYTLLGGHIDRHLENRNIGARAGALFDATRDEQIKAMNENIHGEDGEGNTGQGMDSAAGRYSAFTQDWATRPRFFKTTGGFDTQSLAGFLSECLIKQDVAKLGGEEGQIAAKFISRLTIPPNSKRHKNPLAVAPIFKLAQNRALWAFGKITQARAYKNLSSLLADNVIRENGKPTTIAEAGDDVGIFIDPVVCIENLSKGLPVDSKQKSLMRAIARTGGNFDLYDDWASDMKVYVASYRKEVETSIRNLSVSEDDRKFMLDIIARSISTPKFTLSNKEKERLLTFSDAFKAKFVKYEVLWKEMFTYKKTEIEELLSSFMEKTNLPFVGKVAISLQENFRIKSIWDKELADVIGPGGLATIERDELHVYSVDALRSVMFDNLDLANALIRQPLSIDEIADELEQSSSSIKDDADEADLTTDLAEQQLNINEIIQSAAGTSEVAAIVATVRAAAPDYDDVVSDPEVLFDDKVAYIKKIFSRNFFFTSKPGQEHLKASLIAYIKSNLDSVLDKLDNDEELTAIEKEIEAAGDIATKSQNYLIKFSKAAPTVFKSVSDDLVAKMARVSQSVVDAASKAKELEVSKAVAKAHMNLQSMTSHLAAIHRLVGRGRLVASARAPRLPAEAIYKAAIEQFINFTESKIDAWNKEVSSVPELQELVQIDDGLRTSGSSIDKLSEGDLEIRVDDLNLRVLASDFIVKQLFAVRTMILERKTEISELRDQLGKINISKLQKFQERMQKSEREFEERHELNADLVIEEEEIIQEAPKVLVKELSDLKDRSDKPLTKDEVAKRKSAQTSIRNSIAGLTALLSEGEPKITKWFANAGSTFARLILEFVNNEDFVSKHSVSEMTQIQNFIGEVVDHFDAYGFSPDERDEENTITFLQSIANQIEAIGNPSPDRTDVEIKILPGDEDELLSEIADEPGMSEVKSDENEDLNAEVDATLIVLEKAQKEAKTPEIASAMKNAYMFVEAFASQNRAFVSDADPKTLAGVLSHLADLALTAAADPRPFNINKFKSRQATEAFERLVAAGFAVKNKPQFSDVVQPIENIQAPKAEETSAINPAIIAMNKLIFDAKDFEEKSEKFIARSEDANIDAEELIELRFAIMQLHKVMADAMKADQDTFANMQNVNQLDTHVFSSLMLLSGKLGSTPTVELAKEIKTLVDAILPKAELFANYLKMHLPKKRASEKKSVIRTADGWEIE